MAERLSKPRTNVSREPVESTFCETESDRPEGRRFRAADVLRNPYRRLTKIVFLDKPDDYLAQPRSGSSMVEAPETLRVALHRDALGVYAILAPDDRPRQEKLWREVTYHRVSHEPGWRAEYSARPQGGGR